jgi:hypothetical protein
MATTPNYGWVTPAPTDFVTDLPADFEIFADAVDASFAADEGDLLVGGTSNIFEALPIGAAGTVLTSDGDTASWVAAAGGGKVLQVVQGDLTSTFSTSSGSLVDTGLSVTITPSASNSKVLILASGNVYNQNSSSSANTSALTALLRTSTKLQEVFFGAHNFSTTSSKIYWTFMNFSYLDSPNTTSATTYKIQLATQSGNLAELTSGATQISSIVAMEIGA